MNNKKNALYNYDEDRLLLEKNASKIDVEYILDEIINILTYISTDEMKALKIKNKKIFEKTVEEKFIKFADMNFGLFKAVITGQDLTPLFTMLEGINKLANKEKSLEEVEKDVGNELKKFIPANLK